MSFMEDFAALQVANDTFQTSLLSAVNNLEKAKDSAQYAWKRMEYYAPIYSSGTSTHLINASMVQTTIIYSDEPPIYDPSIQYMRFENGTEFFFDPTVDISDASFLDNKYVGRLINGELTPTSGYYHIEYAESVVSDEPVASGVGYDLRIYNYDYYSVLDTRFLAYVTSDDETEYPADGSVHTDGYVYEMVCDWSTITWADGTDAEISAMIAAADRGEINLADYWSVGDTRSVSLSAMEATGVGESHAAQTVEFTLMHAGGYELNEATAGDRTTCSFIVGMKNCLNETGYMNSSDTNINSWSGSARRTWCNSVFYNAIPSSIRGIFKQFKTITAAKYNGTTNQTSVDYFTLPAAKEVFGGTATSAGSSTGYSNLTEFNALFQYDWYATVSNRRKTVNGTEGDWWERSPIYASSLSFCFVGAGATVRSASASSSYGLSPVGCI